MWKLLTSVVADDIYNHLEKNDLSWEEEKNCRRNNTKDQNTHKDQLLIDKAFMENCRRMVGLNIWRDY